MINVAGITRLVAPVFDKVFLLGDKLVCVNVEYGDRFDSFTFTMTNLFGNTFSSDSYIYLRYDASDKVFTAITTDKHLKLINYRGDELLTGDITLAAGDVAEAVEKGRYTIRNLRLAIQNNNVPISGDVNHFVKLTGKLLLQTTGQITHLNLENGFQLTTPADDVGIILF